MANFKAALEALAVGKLKHESLSKQLDSVLKSSPNFINKMLSELDEVYGQKKLDDKQYSVLKDQITKFMRAHVLKANKNKKSDIKFNCVVYFYFLNHTIRFYVGDTPTPPKE